MEDIARLYEFWNDFALKAACGGFVVGVLFALGYFVKLMSIGDSKLKYDFIVKNETRLLWIASLFILLGAGFLVNSNIEVLTPVWIFVRMFSTFSMILIVGLIIQNLLKFYYPFYVEKRLRVLRHKPRISPKTGKPMKLLSEDEEDAYLDEGMQAEENVFSTDYDVWKDEETGYIKIEKYSGHLHAVECPECNYHTFKVEREEIIKQPEGETAGELLKHYKCAYCDHRVAESVQLMASSKLEGKSSIKD